jgi:hypothetical protein
MDKECRLNASIAMRNKWANVISCCICGKRELGYNWRYRNHKVYCNMHWIELNKGVNNDN